jgi:hypothetical protein
MLMEEERGLRGQHEADEVYASALQAVSASRGADSPLLEDIRRLFDVDADAHASACQTVRDLSISMTRLSVGLWAMPPSQSLLMSSLTPPPPVLQFPPLYLFHFNLNPKAQAAVSVHQLTHEAIIHDMKIDSMPEAVLAQSGDLMLSVELVSAKAGKKKSDARRRVVSSVVLTSRGSTWPPAAHASLHFPHHPRIPIPARRRPCAIPACALGVQDALARAACDFPARAEGLRSTV